MLSTLGVSLPEMLANPNIRSMAEGLVNSNAGLVKVVMNGRHDVKNVSLDPSLMSEDKEMLEDLLAAAVNDAVRRVESSQKDMMKGMTDGFPFPPGFKP